MAHYLSLFVRAVFVENMALAFFPACVRSLPFLKGIDGIWSGRGSYRCAGAFRSD